MKNLIIVNEIVLQTCYVKGMKKKTTQNPPKAKEFVNSAFSALKGVQTATVTPPPPPVAKAAPEKFKVRDEMDLFLLAMSGVERLDGQSRSTGKSSPPPEVKSVVRKIELSEQRCFLEAIEGLKLDVRFSDDLPEPDTKPKSASASRMKQLRRGTITIDYELDLHGLTRDEALEYLESFIKGAQRRGQKAVLVITGKGLHSPDQPVIRTAVEEWMKKEGKEMVAEFFTPPREMGGDGAFAVFLKTGTDPTLEASKVVQK